MKPESFNKLNIALFLLFLGFFSIGTLLFKSESEVENRELTQFPNLPKDLDSTRKFTTDFESYFRDHLLFRKYFIGLYSQTLLSLGQSPTERVILGKDNWLFYAGEEVIEDYENKRLFTIEELKQWEINLSYKNMLLKALGKKYIFVVTPNKHTLYDEKLPSYIVKEKEYSRLDQLISYISQNSDVTIVDLRNTLKNKAANEQLYWSQDTHWNARGAYYGFLDIQKQLDYKPLSITPPHNWVNKYERNQDLSKMILGENSNVYFDLRWPGEEMPCVKSVKQLAGSSTEQFGVRIRNIISSSCKSGSGKALVFRDSFSSELIPYFSQYFEKGVYIWSLTSQELFEHYAKHDFDIVVEQRVERNLRLVPNYPNISKNDSYQTVFQAISDKQLVFDIGNTDINKIKVLNAQMNFSDGELEVNTDTWNPKLFLKIPNLKENKKYLVNLQLVSQSESEVKVYFKTFDKPYFTEENHVRFKSSVGKNQWSFLLNNMHINGEIRIDPGKAKGRYRILKMKVKEVV